MNALHEVPPSVRSLEERAERELALVQRVAAENRTREPVADAERTIDELAKLDTVAYERSRKDAAQGLGMRASALDDEVSKRRAPAQDDSSMFPTVEPWPDAVDGNMLLQTIGATIRAHVIADRPTIVAGALWIVHTYLLDRLTVSPIAHISAPEKRCGKTVLLSAIGRLAHKPLPCANISAAATFRAVEAWAPTLLIDEADAFLRDSEELRGVLNSGHTRDSAFVVRCDGEQNEPRRFSTWCAKAISGIGRIADTLEDRSIPLHLRRKLPGEAVQSLRHSLAGMFDTLRSKLVRWTADHAAEIGAARPESVQGLNDRATDNWEPLLAIADAAGGPWPKLAREAAMRLSAETVEHAAGDELLQAVREVFETRGIERIASADLVDALCADTDAPWATWSRGKPITPRQVARKLADYGITPKVLRIGSGTIRGYERGDFADSWARYLHPSPATPLTSVTTSQANAGAGFSDFAMCNARDRVTDEKPLKPKQDAGCNAVTDKTPPADLELDL